MHEILHQISKEPFLVNILPHLIKFVEQKSQLLLASEIPIPGDVALYSLLLQVLQSVFSNRFFDLDFSLKTVIPILMNVTLFSNFNKYASLKSITDLKDKNAALLSSLVERFH